MADPVQVAIKQEAATRELTETLKSVDHRLASLDTRQNGVETRLAAIEEALKVTAAAAAPVKKGA